MMAWLIKKPPFGDPTFVKPQQIVNRRLKVLNLCV
jgi:hypothetical protein